ARLPATCSKQSPCLPVAAGPAATNGPEPHGAAPAKTFASPAPRTAASGLPAIQSALFRAGQSRLTPRPDFFPPANPRKLCRRPALFGFGAPCPRPPGPSLQGAQPLAPPPRSAASPSSLATPPPLAGASPRPVS